MENNLAFKIIVLGQQNVGKSSLMVRYLKGQYNEVYNVTVGVEFASKLVEVNDNVSVKLQIWDTAGQQTFKAIVKSFYRGMAGVFLVYAINNEESFEALDSWYKQACENGHQEMVFFIIGAQADLDHCRKVQGQRVEKFLKATGAVFYIETSAKTNMNINEVQYNNLLKLFEKAAKIMHKKYISNPAFRHLVRPVMASGIEMIRCQSFSLERGSIKSKSSKKCCH